MRPLPLEIKSAIIDELVDYRVEPSDRADPFSGITLVWPELLFRIRQHRFGAMHLRRPAELRSLLNVLDSDPSIAGVVRSVVFLQYNSTDIRYSDPNLSRLFPQLRNLRTVSLRNITPGPSAVKNILLLPPTVKDVCLGLDWGSWEPFTIYDVLQLLRTFPSMRKLKLTMYKLCDGGDELREGAAVYRCDTLRDLTFHSGFLLSTVFLRMVRDNFAFPRVSAVGVAQFTIRTQYIEPLQQLLHCWRSTLRELRLHHAVWEDEYSGAWVVSLSSLSSSISFRCYQHVHRHPADS